MSDILLPDLGEGVKGGVVTSISVKVGDTVKANDPLIELETDKAVLPVPAPSGGEILKVMVAEGDKITIGQVIVRMSTPGGSVVPDPASEAGDLSHEPETMTAPERKTEPVAKTEPEMKAEPVTKTAPVAKTEDQVASIKVSPNREPLWKAAKATSSPGAGIAAGPATRKLARELGLDLAAVKGSKRGGRIDIEDVKAHVKSLKLGSAKPTSGSGSGASPNWPKLPDFGKFGGVRREKMSNIRSIISQRMSMSWNRVPHVFQFNEVDLTYLADVQKRFKDDFKAKGSSVSPTNFIIKAMAICLKEFPQFNASLDEESGEIIYKDYINIGVAVDTPTGLIVPVLKGVDQMSIFDIGKNLKDLAQRTRERKVTPEELSGGSMTLSNLGGIGGSHFTPIVNWPEVAILGVGRSETKPKWIDGEFKPRECTQMTLSYDHRVIDGADGARFMVRLSQILENIERTLLGG